MNQFATSVRLQWRPQKDSKWIAGLYGEMGHYFDENCEMLDHSPSDPESQTRTTQIQ